MTWNRFFPKRLLNISKLSPPQSLTNYRVSLPAVLSRVPQNAGKVVAAITPDLGDNRKGIFRRFLHERAAFSPEVWKTLVGENLMEKLRGMVVAKDRIRLEGLTLHLAARTMEDRTVDVVGLTVEDARKLLRVAQLEIVKSKLRETGKNWIAYPKYINICREGCSDAKEGGDRTNLLRRRWVRRS